MIRLPVLAFLCALAFPASAVVGGEAAPSRPEPVAPAETRAEPDSEGAYSIGEVIVTPYKTVVDEEVSEKLLLSSDVWKLPLIDNDLMRAVQVHPGVSGGDFSARFAVRGGEPDETLVLLDGMELHDPYHLQDYGGAMSVLDLLAVSRANLFLGGFGAEYGDRLSAVLDVRSKRPRERLSFDAGVDLLNAHLFFSRKPVLLAARAGYIGLLMGMMDTEEQFEPHYGDVLFKLDLGNGGPDEVSAYLLWAVDTNRIDEPGVENDVRSRFHNASSWVKWRRSLSEDVSLETYVYGGWASRHRREGPADLDDRTLSFGGAKAVLDMDAFTGARLKGGLDVRWMGGVYDYLDTGNGFDIDTRVRGVSLKGFASGTWQLSPLLTAEIGSRVLVTPPSNTVYGAPTAALSLHAGDAVTFKCSAGVYLQPVDPLHLPVEAGISEMVRPERAVHYTAGLQYKSDKARVNARVEAFYKLRDHLVGYLRDFGSKTRIYEPKDSGTATGVEILFDKGVGRALLHLAYSYSIARERSGSEEFDADRDTRYAAHLGLSWAPAKDWSVYAGWRYRSGAPYTRVWYEGTVKHTGPRNGSRLPPYHSLDLRIGKTWRWRGAEIQAYLQILNLYNRRNVHEYSFSEETENGTTVFVRREEGLFPILPSLGLNVSF